jgi:L-ascorbate metabolism protein UlaG (beta-lactamase superfamily)
LGRTCDKTPGAQGPGAASGCSVEITVTPALHDHDATNPWKRGDCVGYLIRTPDGSIWHPGDTRLIDELKTFRDVDVLLFDVAYQVPTHLGPDGSAELAKTCGAKVLLAYHYGTMEAPEKGGGYERALQSDPGDSLPFVRDLDAVFLTPGPGEVLTLPL